MSELLQKCQVCRALLDEEDLFCANCGTAAEPASAEHPPRSVSVTHSFECAGCGASMIYSAATSSLRCPFCGSEQLEPQRDHQVLVPRRVVPFRLSQSQAMESLRRFLGSSFWHPGDLRRTAAVAQMSAVYVPYWVFSAEMHTFWTADSGHTPPGARGDWVPVTGEHHGQCRGLLIGASGALTPAETEAICPFELAEGLAPEEVDFSQVAAEPFTVPRKFARPLARAGLEASEAQACAGRYLGGRYRNLKVNVRIEHLHSEPVLLPVWIMAYRYKDQLFRFVVNGQTGKASGQAPFSTAKAVTVVGVVLLVLLVLLVLFVWMGVR